MVYKKRELRNHTIVTIEGSLDIYTAPSFKKDIHALIDGGIESLVMDMVNIRLLDSSGIALLANLHKKLKSEGGKLYLMNVNNDIIVILKLSSLDKFFTILNSEADLP